SLIADVQTDADGFVLGGRRALELVLLDGRARLHDVLRVRLARRRALLVRAPNHVVTQREQTPLDVPRGRHESPPSPASSSCALCPASVTVQRTWGPPASTFAGCPLPQNPDPSSHAN